MTLVGGLLLFGAYHYGAFEGLSFAQGTNVEAPSQSSLEKAFGPVAERIHAGDGWAVLSPAQDGRRKVGYMVESRGSWSTAGPVTTIFDAAEAQLQLEDNLLIVKTQKSGAPQMNAFTYGPKGLQPTDYYTVKAPEPSVKQGPFVLVNKNLNALWHYSDGQLVKAYRVATGRQTQGPAPTADDYKTNFFTPEGIFEIAEFTKNKAYNALKPGDRSYPGGDPNNPLGTRWMGFSVYGWDGTGVWGIHGTSEPDKIGTWASDGCIRMRTEQAEELFGLLQGKRVTLQIVGR